MLRPLTTLRRWLRSRSQKDTLPQIPALPKYRPALTALEDRNAPGDILSGVLAASIGGALLNPMDQVTAWVGSPTSVVPPVTTGRPSTISIGVGTRGEPETPPFHIPLARPETDRAAATTAVGSVVELPTSLDDSLLFVPESQANAGSRYDATLPVPVATASRVEGESNAVQVASGMPASGAIGTVGVASQGEGIPFLLRPTARTQATTNDFGGIAVTGAPSSEQGAGSVRLEGSQGLFSNFEYIAENLPPNTAPVAGDDSASVDEDGSVVISVLANDTDADLDDVLRIDTWNWQPVHGTVTQDTDGKLTYTPFADFHGTDTFTYAATDTRDVSNTATVTVTVTPVNDVGAAFDDAYMFSRAARIDEFLPLTVGEGAGSVLANDIDFDGDTLTASLVTGPSIGSVSLSSDGTFLYTIPANEPPLGSSYETTFTYKASDGNGWESDPTTVTIWVHRATLPAAPPATAEGDVFPVGQDAISGGVAGNDSGELWILTGHPTQGRLTTFSTGGVFNYTPTPSSGDQTFSYVVYSDRGRYSATANVQMAEVNLEIFHGQDGAVVRAADETTIGAFTVVNWNDTDGDGTKDVDDKNGVLSGQGVGGNEVDLMCIRVHNPAGFGKNAGDTITVEIKGGEALFFGTSKREQALGTKIPLTPASFNDPVVGQPQKAFLDFWAEASAPSNQMRTIEIEMTAKLGGVAATNKVAATGVWTALENNGFHVAGNKRGADADGKAYIDNFEGLSISWNDAKQSLEFTPGFSLGTPDMFVVGEAVSDGKGGAKLSFYSVNLRNVVEMEYYVTPSGLSKVPVVVLDMTRTVEAHFWQQEVGGKLGLNDQRVFPTWRDRANDDGYVVDEDNIPNGQGQHIYSFDPPGSWIPVTPADYTAGKLNQNSRLGKSFTRFVQRMNAEEFTRVKVNGKAFDHNPDLAKGATTLAAANSIDVQGSRASNRHQWHSWSDFTWDAAQSKWVRTSDPAPPGNVGAGQMTSRNSIGPDHYFLNTPDSL